MFIRNLFIFLCFILYNQRLFSQTSIDSNYTWKWDTINVNWANDAYKKSITTTDSINGTRNVLQYKWNGSSWINDKQFFHYFPTSALYVMLEQIWNGGSWENVTTDTSTYDVNNKPLYSSTHSWSGSSWNILRKLSYQYDSAGNQTLYTNLIWTAGTITTGYNSLKTYDANNNVIIDILQNWDSIGFVNIMKYEMTYDINNNLNFRLKYSGDQAGTGWDTLGRNYYTYDSNNNLIYYTAEDFISGSYVYTLQKFSVYDTNQNLTNNLYQIWQGTWVNSSIDSMAYDSNNNMVYFQTQDWINNSWLNQNRYIYTYNSNNDLIQGLSQIWANGSWENVNQNFQVFDSNNRIQDRLFQIWDQISWKDINRHTYGYYPNGDMLYNTFRAWDATGTYINTGDSTTYIYHLLTGIEFNNFTSGNFLLYPNPAREYLFVSTPGINDAELSVFDFSGRLLYRIPDYNDNCRISLSGWKSGVYILSISSKEKTDFMNFIVVE